MQRRADQLTQQIKGVQREQEVQSSAGRTSSRCCEVKVQREDLKKEQRWCRPAQCLQSTRRKCKEPHSARGMAPVPLRSAWGSPTLRADLICIYIYISVCVFVYTWKCRVDNILDMDVSDSPCPSSAYHFNLRKQLAARGVLNWKKLQREVFYFSLSTGQL